jgi:hypothetical protein
LKVDVLSIASGDAQLVRIPDLRVTPVEIRTRAGYIGIAVEADETIPGLQLACGRPRGINADDAP